nr:MAG TPA: zinc finger domain protein [Caudoviricetes sp.]
MKDYMGKSNRQCSYCGKKFSMFFYDIREYVYKVKEDKKYLYQCSYPCYRKEKERHENTRNASQGPSPEGNRVLK